MICRPSGLVIASPAMSEAFSRRKYIEIMTIIGSGHALSHLYMLVLPPLFPLLKAEFDASYAALGLLVTLMNLVTGVFQLPSGILVDRFGARRILTIGMTLMGVAFVAMGWAPSYAVVLILMVTAGLGGSVFHPADYAIMTETVPAERMGRAFALHTFTGNLGFMAAPTSMIAIAAVAGWRGAVIAAGAAAFIVVIALVTRGHLLEPGNGKNTAPGAAAQPAPERVPTRALMTPPILIMFAFFVLISIITNGVQTFSVTALTHVQGLGLAGANTALSAFLVTAAFGVLLGGPLADKTDRHGIVVGLALLGIAALMSVVGGVDLPLLAVIVTFTAMGLLQGVIRPNRDMMIRAITPPGASGRVFAFVSTGLNIGGAVAPVLFGYLIDIGYARAVFFAMAGIMVAAFVTMNIGRAVARAAREPAAAE